MRDRKLIILKIAPSASMPCWIHHARKFPELGVKPVRHRRDGSELGLAIRHQAASVCQCNDGSILSGTDCTYVLSLGRAEAGSKRCARISAMSMLCPVDADVVC